MSQPTADAVFAGAVPELYDLHLVPMIFEPYAQEVARRAAALSPRRVLETAAGTGAVTRELSRALPERTEIIATDLNPAMLERAREVGTLRPVRWQQADAMQLPFEDGSFDLVVCQFGAMFFPDKVQGYREALRVLRPGGKFILAVWDRIEDNEFTDVVVQPLAACSPADPPRFLRRTPHGYFERDVIVADLADAGFTQPPQFDTVSARSRASSAQIPAIALCQGTPMRGEIEARQPPTLAEATAACVAALTERFGTGAVDAKIQAHVVTVVRS